MFIYTQSFAYLACLELHRLEYGQAKLEYLDFFAARKKQQCLRPDLVVLREFSDPEDTCGYDDKSISDDLISDVYLAFSSKTRIPESQESLRTLTGQ